MKFEQRNDIVDLNFHTPPFSAGEFAAKYSQLPPNIAKDLNWVTRTLHQKLFLAACAGLGIQNGDHVQGVMALPLKIAKTLGPEVEKLYTREWQIDDIRFSASIETKAQGICAAVFAGVEYGKKAIFKKGVVVDFGGGTTDVVDIRDGARGNRCGTHDGLGMNQIAVLLQSELARRGITISEQKARLAVLERKYEYKGSLVPGIPGGIDEKTKEIAEKVWSYLLTKIPAEHLQEFGEILLTGKGGELILPYLKEIDDRFWITKNPQFDNANGALLGAMTNKKRNVVYMGFDLGLSHVKATRWYGDHAEGICFRSLTAERIMKESVE